MSLNPQTEWQNVLNGYRAIYRLAVAFQNRIGSITAGELANGLDSMAENLALASGGFAALNDAISQGDITLSEVREIVGQTRRPVPANLSTFLANLETKTQDVLDQYAADTPVGDVATLNFSGSFPHSATPANVSAELQTAITALIADVQAAFGP